MVETFYRDLHRGKQIEYRVLDIVKYKYPLAYIIDGYCKDWDIYIPEIEIGIEVKSDEKSKYTGNIEIEIEFNGKPSALSTTKAKYWVVYDGYEFKWFLVKSIKKCILENNLSPCKFIGKGDTKYKIAYLIKKTLLYNYGE